MAAKIRFEYSDLKTFAEGDLDTRGRKSLADVPVHYQTVRLKILIKELIKNKEVTVLISSHDLTHVTEVCERIVVLDKGNVVKDIQTSTETLKELESYFSV